MLSSCKPVQSIVNMQIERYGKRKAFPHLCTAILGNLKYFLLFKLLKTVMMKKYAKKTLNISYKSLETFINNTLFCYRRFVNYQAHGFLFILL